MRWLTMAGILLVLIGPQPAHAQFFGGPAGPGFATRGGFSLGYSGRRVAFSAFYGRSAFYPYGPFGSFQGYATAGPWYPPPVFVGPFVPRPVILPVNREELDDEPRVPNPDRFILIRPDKPKDMARNNLPEPPPVFPAPKLVKPVKLDIEPAPLPLAPGRAAKPRAEADQQIERGRIVFANDEYGRAIEHFRRAAAFAPDESTASFLLAQAQFAVGKYDEAVANITDGLKRRPDWPKSRYRSRELYRDKMADYDAHLQNLRDALAADLDDPRLLFLLGVQLWFDGKQEAAKPLLERAAKTAKDPTAIRAFLD